MKFRKKRRTVPEEEFDITSLLDVLVILLVFLLKNYNESEVTINLIDEIALPYSQSRQLVKSSVTVQMNRSKIVQVGSQKIGRITGRNFSSDFTEAIDKVAVDREKRSLINLVVDKKLLYKDINKLLRVIDNQGFSQYKLIIEERQN